MKTKIWAFLILSLVFTLKSFAQENDKRFGFEFSTGVSMATTKLSDATLNPGFGFEGIFHYDFASRLGLYGGWGWNRFGAEESFAGNNTAFEETGYILGLQYKQPIGTSKTSWYLRAGALYAHVETENDLGDVIHNSGHGLGYQLAGGFDFALGKNWSLTPGIKFNSLSRDVNFEETARVMNHNYASLRIGLLKKF